MPLLPAGYTVSGVTCYKAGIHIADTVGIFGHAKSNAMNTMPERKEAGKQNATGKEMVKGEEE